jgi:hypothetical protein
MNYSHHTLHLARLEETTVGGHRHRDALAHTAEIREQGQLHRGRVLPIENELWRFYRPFP